MCCPCHSAHGLFLTDASDPGAFWDVKYGWQWDSKMTSLASKSRALELPAEKTAALERLENGVRFWQNEPVKRECFRDLGIELHNPKSSGKANWYTQLVCKRCQRATRNFHIFADDDEHRVHDFDLFLSCFETYHDEWDFTTASSSTPAALTPARAPSPSIPEEAPPGTPPWHSARAGGRPYPEAPATRRHYCRYEALRQQKDIQIISARNDNSGGWDHGKSGSWGDDGQSDDYWWGNNNSWGRDNYWGNWDNNWSNGWWPPSSSQW